LLGKTEWDTKVNWYNWGFCLQSKGNYRPSPKHFFSQSPYLCHISYISSPVVPRTPDVAVLLDLPVGPLGVSPVHVSSTGKMPVPPHCPCHPIARATPLPVPPRKQDIIW
jgi:hypothetical protein